MVKHSAKQSTARQLKNKKALQKHHVKDNGVAAASLPQNAGRPKRSAMPSNFKLEPEATGMSWAEEAALKRALYASMQASKKKCQVTDKVVIEDAESTGKDDTTLFQQKASGSTASLFQLNTISPVAPSRDSCAKPYRLHETQQQVLNAVNDRCMIAKKVRAQRKFAQPGSSSLSSSTCHTPEKAVSKNTIIAKNPCTLRDQPVFTEDFLTYLCFRGRAPIPNHLSSLPGQSSEVAQERMELAPSMMAGSAPCTTAAGFSIAARGHHSTVSSNSDDSKALVKPGGLKQVPDSYEERIRNCTAALACDARVRAGLAGKPRHTSLQSEALAKKKKRMADVSTTSGLPLRTSAEPRKPPPAESDDLADPIGRLIYLALSSRGTTVKSGLSSKLTNVQIASYIREELCCRKLLRDASLPTEEFVPPPATRSRKSIPLPTPTTPPFTCSVTGHHCHLSFVSLNQKVLSTRYATSLGATMCKDASACLFTIVSEKDLISFAEGKRFLCKKPPIKSAR